MRDVVKISSSKTPSLTIWMAFVMVAGMAGGCAKPDTVLFVTKTSIGVLDADTTPPEISIAYNRTEGYIGPRYDNGAVPPVYGSIESDATILNPKVRQLYATGDAAELVTSNQTPEPSCYGELVGDSKLMFFGTSTNTGLKITFGTTGTPGAIALPNSFSFGFRRKEFSLIPVGETDRRTGDRCETADPPVKIFRYPAVIASIDTTGRIGDVTNIGQPGQPVSGVGLQTAQFIATGAAARNLAPWVRPAFIQRATEAVGGSVVTFGPTDTTEKLKEIFAADPSKQDKAVAYISAKNPPVDYTSMMFGKENEALRLEVLKLVNS